MNTNTPSSADPIGDIADAFVDAFRQGKRPSVEEFAGRYPEHADELREILPGLLLMEKAKSPENATADQPSSGPASPTSLRQLGDYRILREIGRGGMGVVYEADQQSLGRRVALKILPFSATQDAKKAARFRREARSAARLHHTNIVPVFDVGQDGDTCYYAMQLIQGQGLDQIFTELRRLRSNWQGSRGWLSPASPAAEVIPPSQLNLNGISRPYDAGQAALALLSGTFERPTLPPGAATAERLGAVAVAETPTLVPSSCPGDPEPTAPAAASPTSSAVLPGRTELSSVQSDHWHYFRSVARIGQQTALALAHAHTRGVLHRDVKPSNLLLDAAGVVWVTDFGLAKTEAEDLTGTGEILGTLRYMPPERFEGTGDGRADVYSLGVTMYELLVLQPAFDSPDRLKLMAQICADDPVRPRALDPRIPRDLETIVLKAIEKNPARRYQSAGDLAEDLRRFIDDEPIKARRTSAAERYWRWARHNPVVAVLGGVLTAVLVLATAGSLIVAGRMAHLAENERNAAQAERLAREESDQARKDATARERSERWERYRSDIAAASAAQQLQNSSTGKQSLEAAPEEHRNWEWRHLYSQLDGASLVLQVPGIYHNTLRLRPDGRQIAVGSTLDGCRVHLFDAVTGRAGPVLPGYSASILEPTQTYSPDGRQLAIGLSDGTIRIIDSATGRQQLILRGEWRQGSHLCYRADGKRIASFEMSSGAGTGQGKGKYRLWDTTTGQQLAILGEGHITDLSRTLARAFRPDGKRVFAATDEEFIGMYDADTGRQLSVLGPHGGPIDFIACSPDGKRFVVATYAGRAAPACLRDGETGAVVAVLDDQKSLASTVAFSANGSRLAISSLYPDNAVRLWDPGSGKLVRTMSGHVNTVVALVFSPDGKWLASASLDQTSRLWDGETGKEIAVLRGHTGPLLYAAFSPDSTRLVTTSGAGGRPRHPERQGSRRRQRFRGKRRPFALAVPLEREKRH
jgi:WD40 repeat protein